MVNVTVAILPLLLTGIGIMPDQNETDPSDLAATLASLSEALDVTSLEGMFFNRLSDMLAETPSAEPTPAQRRSDPDNNSAPKMTSLFTKPPIMFKQAPVSAIQRFLTPLTNMIGTIAPFMRQHPQPDPATAPAETPASHKNENRHTEQAKDSQSYPEGVPVVPGGYFDAGWKGDGEYFSYKKPLTDSLEVNSLEVNSHEDVSPGKFYDEKSEHPYYIVDKLAEGPVTPPLTYFTSGLRSEPDTSAAAWNDYYAKLHDYNAFYSSYYQRKPRSTDENRKIGADASVKSVQQAASEIDTNMDTAIINQILESDQAVDV